MPNIFDARATYASTPAFLVSRDELPHLLNARNLLGCAVEVGVKEGEFSSRILELWRGSHLVSVDPWMTDDADNYIDIANVPQTRHDYFYEKTVARLEPFGSRSTIWRMTSIEASQRILHHSLDFVYLDARHDYASVMEDLNAWADKVRPGGILAGHDYLDGRLREGDFGVKSAVDEFFAARDWRVHATLDDEPWLSWIVEIPGLSDAVPGAEFVSDEERAAAPAANPSPAQPTNDPEDRVIQMTIGAGSGSHVVKMSLDPSQFSQRLMLQLLERNEMYEPETSNFFASVLKPGDSFIDIGTHVGYFSLLAATLVGPEGKVISFEPEKRNFRRLRCNLALNGFTHVEPVNAAVGEASGTASLFVNQDNDGGHALWDVGLHPFNHRSRKESSETEVDVVSLDAFLSDRELSSLKLIKIDAEGSEHRVLLGARAILERYRVPFVVVEINDFALEQMATDEASLRAWMEDLGYQTFAFLPGGMSMVRLRPEQHIESDDVYNLVFRHSAAPDLSVAA